MRVEKGAVFFDKIFNLMFLLCFSVIRWNFGIFLVVFNSNVKLVCFSFFVFRFSLFVFRFSLFVIRYPLFGFPHFVFRYSFFVIRFSLFVFRFLTFESGRISYFDIQNPIKTFELVPSIVF